jgi:flagellin
MGSVINTNTLSLLTQNNLTKSQSAMETAIARLSSGMRINSAKDDAAGQAIANRFNAAVKGLTQAQRNANDGISLAQTTEGALNEVNNNLQRIRELTVQAANGSNSNADKVSIQAEITQRLKEIDRTSEQTDFNGTKVLNSNSKLAIQVGANDGEKIEIGLSTINAATLGLANMDITRASLDLTKVANTATTELSPIVPGDPIDTVLKTSASDGGATLEVYVDDADPNKLYLSNDSGTTLFAATYNNETGTLEIDSVSGALDNSLGAISSAAASTGQALAVGDNVTVNIDDITLLDKNPASEPKIYIDEAGDFYVSKDGSDFVAATLVGDTVTYLNDDFATSNFASPNATSEILTVAQAPVAATPAVTADLTDLEAALVGTSASLRALTNADGSDGGYVVKGQQNGSDVYYMANVDDDGKVTLGAQLNPDPLASIDAALAQVDTLRGSLGAVQNRFDSVISNLGTTINNLTSSKSRIEDADYATEVSNMTRAQILQQAGTSVLAKANQSTQGVMALLQ